MCPWENRILGAYPKKSAAPGTHLRRVRCVRRGLPGKPPGEVHSPLLAAAHHRFAKPQGSADGVIRYGASSGVPKCGAGLSTLQPIPIHGRLPAASGTVPGILEGKEFYHLFRRTSRSGPAFPDGADFRELCGSGSATALGRPAIPLACTGKRQIPL